LDDVPSVPRSFNIVDFGNGEQGPTGYPQVPPLPTRWGKVTGGRGADVLAGCDRAPTAEGTLTMVGWDVLQPARVSHKMGRKSFPYLVFHHPSPTA
jgi:hypothetical protein